MPLYEYKAINTAGKNLKGVVNAASPTDAKTKLRKDGLYLTEIKESQGGQEDSVPGNVKIGFGGRVNSGDIAMMTRQLATLIGAGIPLVESLTALSEQVENLSLKKALSDIRDKVNEGASMADAMKAHQNIFSSLFINMIRAGELSGAFEQVLDRLADYSENQDRLKGKVMSALAYPIVMMLIAFLALIAIFAFVIPKLVRLYEDMDQALPLPTQILIGISNAFTQYWYLLILMGAAIIFLIKKYLKTDSGKYNFHSSLLKMPIFGKMFRMVSIARFSSTLSTLLASGVPILTAMDIVKNVINNLVLTNVIEKVRVNLREGDSISEPLKRSGEFPPLVTHMISVGEKTGELERMLSKIAETYNNQVDQQVSTITSLIEPIMMVVLMVGIGFIVMSVMLPIFNMNQAIG